MAPPGEGRGAPLAWMLAAGGAGWGLATAATGGRLHPELLWGLLGPLVATVGTWIVTERAFRTNPQALTGIMVAGLGVKAVCFGVFVVVMLRGLDLRPAPFIGSFTGFFIALYGLEALFLKRLFARGPGRR